ncbi:DUF433 domain-containing protein [Candidatus Poribacteria bacterium]|nr:DUF433 domain-containing protein [Candidatus Poribacteria bacterium]
MELESNFDFLSHGFIRIKGTRIGIEIILDDYLNGHSPEEISVRYRNLTLKQVYAAITYYFFNQEKMDAYLNEWRRGFEEAWLEQRRSPDSVIKRLLEIKAKREAGGECL